MDLFGSHSLLIYHDDSKIYEGGVRKRLPHLKIYSAERPEDAFPHIEEARSFLPEKSRMNS